MCAGLLTSGTLRLKNVPMLADVKTTQKLLQGMGARVLTDNVHEFEINGGTVNNTCAPYELVKTMRASILVLGPTLARFGEAQVSLPGGCAIGSRPVDQHLKGLETMGAEITIEHGYVKAKGRLKGARVVMDMITVGGTENLLMAATLAEGTTVLENCAIEPEVVDLAECLVKMGAKISGIGTSTMTVEGVKELHGCEHSVVPDRIEAGTFLCAVAMTGGKVVLRKAAPKTMEVVLDKLVEAGAIIEAGDDWISIDMQQRPKAVNIRTTEHPGFPTDMQAQFMAMNAVAEGDSRVVETIFETASCTFPNLTAWARTLPPKATPPSSKAWKNSPAPSSWRPTCAPPPASSWQAWSQAAKLLSNASTTSTAATNTSRKNSAKSARKSNGYAVKSLVRTGRLKHPSRFQTTPSIHFRPKPTTMREPS